MNMTKENRAEIKRLKQEDKLALGELKIINRNMRKVNKDCTAAIDGITRRAAAAERAAIAEIKGVMNRRKGIANRIALINGRNS